MSLAAHFLFVVLPVAKLLCLPKLPVPSRTTASFSNISLHSFWFLKYMATNSFTIAPINAEDIATSGAMTLGGSEGIEPKQRNTPETL